MNTIFSWRIRICATMLALPITAAAQWSGGTAATTSTPIEPIPLRARFLIGPRVGGNRNFHSGGFRTISEANCPKFAQGSGFGYLAGLTAEYVGGSHWGIIPAITYESRPGRFSQQLANIKVGLAGFPDPVDQTIEASSDIAYRMVNMEVLYKYEFAFNRSFRVSVAAGPAAAAVLGGKITQAQDLVLPLDARFISHPE
ncbi:MAG: outer membrane beta-barrel protein, partial [Bacteroidota bacterium]